MNTRLYQNKHIEIWLSLALLIGFEAGPPTSIWIGPIEITIWT